MRSATLAIVILCFGLNTKASADTVILLDGQELDGIVTGVTDNQITLQKQGESILLSKKLVLMIFIGSEYRDASPARRKEMQQARTSDPLSRVEDNPRKPGSEGKLEEARPVNDYTGASYLWLQVGPADVNDFTLPLINQIRNYALFTELFPSMIGSEQVEGYANFTDIGWRTPLSQDFYGELRISGYRIQGSAPKLGYELDIINGNGLNFNLVNGSITIQRHDALYYQATVGYQAALGESGWILEPRFSGGYTMYNVATRQIVGGVSPLTPALFAAQDDVSLAGTWPSLGMGVKLRYCNDLDQSEYYILLEAQRTQGHIQLDIDRYSAGGIAGNGYRGADFHFTGYALLAELGYVYRIIPNWGILMNVSARKEQFTVNDSYYYATIPPVSGVDPLIPLSYKRAPQIRVFSGESYSISFGIRLYY